MTIKKEGWAESFGWLHRSEYDTNAYDTWETPDGRLYAFYNKGFDPWLVDSVIMNGRSKQLIQTFKKVKNG
jgi:hypothetical protein